MSVADAEATAAAATPEPSGNPRMESVKLIVEPEAD
jgi:hypothetical protein